MQFVLFLLQFYRTMSRCRLSYRVW